MSVSDAPRGTQWVLLMAMVFGCAVLVVPAAVRAFMLPKGTLIAVAALGLAAVAGVRAVVRRTAAVPGGRITLAVGVFTLSLLLSTLFSSAPLTSVIGTYGRYAGTAAYAAYVVVFFTVLATLKRELGLVWLLRTMAVALVAVLAYAALQGVDADPVAWGDAAGSDAFASFGNIDFAAAWVGCVAALAFALAMWPEEGLVWRSLGAVGLVAALFYVLSTGTSQGPVVALVGLVWAGVVIASAPGSRVRRQITAHRTAAWGGVAALGIALLVLVLTALPLLRAQLEQALVERPAFWSAAIRVFLDHPIVGTGPATFGHFFPAYRPASHAVEYGILTTDTPHSVPLAMLANGGLLVFIPYMAFVLLVGVILLRRTFRSEGFERMTLAGFGGTWLGYQAQSLISFDVPPLALLHWLSAGVIVAVAAPPDWREVRLPRFSSGTRSALTAGVVLVAIVAAWFVLYPFRADLAAKNAIEAIERGDGTAALQSINEASELNPAEGSYPYFKSRLYEEAGEPKLAAAAAVEAAKLHPGAAHYALAAGWQSYQAGEEQAAIAWYREAADRDPRHPAVLSDVAGFFLDLGRRAEAREYIERALRLDPDYERAQQQLAAVEGP